MWARVPGTFSDWSGWNWVQTAGNTPRQLTRMAGASGDVGPGVSLRELQSPGEPPGRWIATDVDAAAFEEAAVEADDDRRRSVPGRGGRVPGGELGDHARPRDQGRVVHQVNRSEEPGHPVSER